eukprot:TRINITY_DN7311_c0_g3_i1.p1 TRINITY_DN7311_c0_g3~~TRINITY_DN7311_c0_g3_i1.p1  ORF type:complete len:824 (+),score=207.93 TRINITY_DN7311_c0_g3_i1:161-2473(+)
MEIARKDCATKLHGWLVDIHELAKKIEILEENLTDNNIKVVAEPTINRVEELIPKKTHDEIVGILNTLRRDPHYLTDAIARCGWLDVDSSQKRYHAKMARVLVGCLFRVAFSPLDEQFLLKFMQAVGRAQFFVIPKSAPMDRLSPFFARLFQAFSRFTGVNEYLKEVMQETLMKIVSEESSFTTPKVKTLVDALIQRTLTGVRDMPIGIKIIAKELRNVAMSEGRSEKEIQHLMRELIFDHFLFLCLTKPHFYAAIIGVSIVPSQKAILRQISEEMLQMLAGHPSLPFLFNEIVDVDDASYFKSANHDVSVFRNFVITKSEIESIISLMQDAINPPKSSSPLRLPQSKLGMPGDPVRKLLDAFIAEQHVNSAEKTSYHRIHPRCLVQLFLPRLQRVKQSVKIDPVTKEIKRNLSAVLSEVSFLPGYSNKTIIGALESLSTSGWNKNKLSMKGQLHDIIKQLQELPDQYRDKEYDLLLTQIMEDHQTRMKDAMIEHNEMLLAWDQLQTHMARVKAGRQVILEYLTSIKLELFNHEWFNSLRQNFVSSFLQKQTKESICNCDMMKSQNCDFCLARSVSIKSFMDSARDTVTKHALWRDCDAEEITMALIQIERTIMSTLYDHIFPQVRADFTMNVEIKSINKTFSLADFEISPKYHSEAPWPLAQAEIEKMNSLKSPHDKLLCIGTAWEIISKCVSLVDDPGPDACFPIMSYVLYLVAPKAHLFANTHYIEMYCTTLDEYEEGRLMTFRLVVKALSRTITETGWGHAPNKSE